nr:MAG TPA: hypothetical protein [Caudoviricetes sp.]DAS14438.1 MAG TPA: hypothetical protein [Caudoviricetes sp.]
MVLWRISQSIVKLHFFILSSFLSRLPRGGNAEEHSI